MEISLRVKDGEATRNRFSIYFFCRAFAFINPTQRLLSD